MFRFLRRVSGSLLPRPDRPWRDDATSHAPTIGRKRRYSVTEQDPDDSRFMAKRTRNDPVKPGTECDSVSEGKSPKGDAISPVKGQEVKEVTKGVKEVELEDKDKPAEAASSICPEGVPLPDSPSGSPEPEPDSADPAEVETRGEAKDQEHASDKDSMASSAPKEEDPEDSGRAEAETVTINTDATAEGVIPAVESGSHDTLETLEVKVRHSAVSVAHLA